MDSLLNPLGRVMTFAVPPSLLESAVIFAARHQLRGRSRLARLARGAHPVTLVRINTRDGLTFAVDPEGYMDGWILREGYYEREVLDTILAQLPQNGVLWDVGANVGLHAITVKALRPDVTVIAFEPVPFAAARFLYNLELNGSTVQLLPVALGDSEGYFPMSIQIRGNTGQSSLAPRPDYSYEAVITCRVDRGDALIAAGIVPAPDVLKLDVEGFEPQALAGLRDTLVARRTRAVVFESCSPDEFDAARGPLEASGYEIAPVTPSATVAPTNFVALRQRAG